MFSTFSLPPQDANDFLYIKSILINKCLLFIPSHTCKLNILHEVTIHTLPHLKCIKLVSVRLSHLPFKMRPCVEVSLVLI